MMARQTERPQAAPTARGLRPSPISKGTSNMKENTTTAQPSHGVFGTTRFKRYVVPTGSCSLKALPFVDYPEGTIRGPNATHWKTEPAADYEEAAQRGQEYGAHLAQYFKDNPMWVSSGITAKIIGDIGKPDNDIDRGYLVGFCSYLEQLIHASARNSDIESHIAEMRHDHDRIVDNHAVEGA